MSTADALRERAMSLVNAGLGLEEAVNDLLEYSEERRVPVVLAHQQILRDLEAQPSDLQLSRAEELLDHVLRRLPME